MPIIKVEIKTINFFTEDGKKLYHFFYYLKMVWTIEFGTLEVFPNDIHNKKM